MGNDSELDITVSSKRKHVQTIGEQNDKIAPSKKRVNSPNMIDLTLMFDISNLYQCIKATTEHYGDYHLVQSRKVTDLISFITRIFDSHLGFQSDVRILVECLLDLIMQGFSTVNLQKQNVLDYVITKVLNDQPCDLILKSIVPQGFTFPVPGKSSCDCGYPIPASFKRECHHKKKVNSSSETRSCSCHGQCALCLIVSYLRRMFIVIRNAMTEMASTGNDKELRDKFKNTLNELCEIQCEKCKGTTCIVSLMEADNVTKVVPNFLSSIYGCKIPTIDASEFMIGNELMPMPLPSDVGFVGQYSDELTICKQKIDEYDARLRYLLSENAILKDKLQDKEKLVSVLQKSDEEMKSMRENMQFMATQMAVSNSRIAEVVEGKSSSEERLIAAISSLVEISAKRTETYTLPYTGRRPLDLKGVHLNISGRKCGICKKNGHNQRTCPVVQTLKQLEQFDDIESAIKRHNGEEAEKLLKERTQSPHFKTLFAKNNKGIPLPDFESQGAQLCNSVEDEVEIESGIQMHQINPFDI